MPTNSPDARAVTRRSAHAAGALLCVAALTACGETSAPSQVAHSATPRPADESPARTPSAAAASEPPPSTFLPTPQATPEERQDLVIVESGFSYLAGGAPSVTYAAVSDYPNRGVANRASSFAITWYDTAGGHLWASGASLGLLLPGRRTAIIAEGYLTSAPATMEVEYSSSWRRLRSVVGDIAVENVVTSRDDAGLVTTGVVVSTLSLEPPTLEDELFPCGVVVAVYYDAAGHIIGGAEGPFGFDERNACDPNRPPADGRIVFEVRPRTEIPGLHTTMVYVHGRAHFAAR